MERILFLTWGIEFGGLEVGLLDVFSGIDYSKVTVVLGCRQPDIFREKLATKGLSVDFLKFDEPFRDTFPAWFRAISSMRPHKVVFVEGVFAQFPLAAILAAWWLTRNHALLFLCGWGHSLPAALPSGLYRFRQLLYYRLRNFLVRHTITVSQDLKNKLVTSFGYPPNRITVEYYGVDTSQFRASPADRVSFRQAHGIPLNSILVTCPGRMARVKRQDRIVKAFKTLSQKYDDLWLLLTSYGPLKDEVEKMVAECNLAHHVRLVGFQLDTSVLLKAGDIYVMASDGEGFPIALLEAMASELVCVATDCGGPREVIEDGKNGFLVGVNDEAVVEGLRRAVSLQPEERIHMATMARKTIEGRFQTHVAVRQTLDAMGIPRTS